MRLTIENFSCIQSADIELGAINVLIGPQASGKSVISKLIYFFLDLQSDQQEKISQEKTFDTFSEDLKIRFADWFPISAWGAKKFKIEFEAGDFKVRLTRVSYAESINNNLRLWVSAAIKDFHKQSLELVKATKAKATRSNRSYANFELSWQIREELRKALRVKLGENHITELTFIPAGRSFFTNLGRAFMAFDQGRILDPITVRFGRLYSSVMHEPIFMGDGARSKDFEKELAEILGGELQWEGERVAVRCADGRIIPISALSSGQQELFPLFIAFGVLDRFSDRKDKERSELTIIEEPEAHLFPSAQSRLIQGLVGFSNTGHGGRRILLTTHSPYVLAKINNLIKAGQLERTLPKEQHAGLNRAIPKKSRISLNSARAYAIIGDAVVSIIDNDGLINAEYLDDVSSDIGGEFSKLLDLEFQQ